MRKSYRRMAHLSQSLVDSTAHKQRKVPPQAAGESSAEPLLQKMRIVLLRQSDGRQ